MFESGYFPDGTHWYIKLRNGQHDLMVAESKDSYICWKQGTFAECIDFAVECHLEIVAEMDKENER